MAVDDCLMNSIEQYAIELHKKISFENSIFEASLRRSIMDFAWGIIEDNYASLSGGGSGTGGRTGTTESKNGTMVLTDEQKSQIESHISVNVDDVEDKGETLITFWDSFWKANSEMTQEEFDYYTENDFFVRIMCSEDFFLFSVTRKNGTGTEIGWSKATEEGIFLTFGESIFGNDYNWDDGFHVYPINPFNSPFYNDFDLTSVLQHEFGHGFGAWKLGISEYNSMASFYKENWAIWYTNESYRKDFRIPLRQYETGSFLGVFDWLYKGKNP